MLALWKYMITNLITEKATEWLVGGEPYSMETLDSAHPGGVEWDSARFQRAAQNCTQFKTYELVISGIFRLVFLDDHWPRVTELVGSETIG